VNEVLEKLRSIRTLADPQLKPSPYLKSEYVDEYDNTNPVALRNYQKSGILNLLMVERSLLGDDCGLGKAQPIDANVLTPSGWTEIGKLAVGDCVIGSDGKPTKICGIFPQGRKDIYKVTMSDDSSAECCEDHLWTVRTGNTRRSGGWKVFSLKHIVAAGLLRCHRLTGRRWSIPMVEPVQFTEKHLPVDPYLLGVLLGGGSLPGTIAVSNGDPKLFDLVRSRLPADCRFGTRKKDGITISVIGRAGVRNSLQRGIIELGLMKKNWYTKFIPSIYLLASVSQRIELLRGLMDTDGYVSKDGKVTQFYSSNKTLVDDFVHLIQSLGGVAKVKSKMPTLRGKSRAKNGRLAYTVTISLPNSILPFYLPRKVSRWVPRTKYPPIRYIAKVELSREAECVCISVEAENDLYVTNHFIVTHNTLEALSAIGYIWLKEPEYVPIIIAKKSALHQWGSEVQKFLVGMSTVTVEGQPFERDNIYQDFFLNYNKDSKRLLILTYEILFKDLRESVVKDRSEKPDKDTKNKLKQAKLKHKQILSNFESGKFAFQAHFNERPFGIQEHVKDRLNIAAQFGASAPVTRPGMWDDKDEQMLLNTLQLKEAVKESDNSIKTLSDLIAPPKIVPGIMNYILEMQKLHPNAKLMFVMDEVHTVKNYRGKIHATCYDVAAISNRVIGMTATPVKNRLMEFFSIFRIIQPKLFPRVSHFMNEFCVTKLQPIGGGRKVPIVVGYKNLDKFIELIEPYYLSRRKHEVAKELPQLVTRELVCELTADQEELYDLAEVGLLNKNDDDSSSAEILSSMVMVQQAANAPQLIADENGVPFEGESSKLNTLLDLFQNELCDTKTIVFSRFEKMVSLIEKELIKNNIKCVRITGKENKAKDREIAKNIFQDPNSGTNIILITTAGSESINLQSAEHLIFVDMPWSFGDYAQTTGRMIRIGSHHLMVMVTHLMAIRRNGKKTIDHHVLKTLKSKKKLIDKVAGDTLHGGLEVSDTMDIFKSIREEHSDKATPARKIHSAKNKPKISTAKHEVPPAQLIDIDLSSI